MRWTRPPPNESQPTKPIWSPAMLHKTEIVNGVRIYYREAGTPGAPKLLLLHGFPASSHQYRNLIASLSDTFHIIAPDYPVFGNSEMPDPSTYAYTFDSA